MALRDARGRLFHSLGERPLRLVSLVPSTTETLFALGRGPDLVGYTRFCVHPRGLVSSAQWIGGTKNPKLDRIVALQPDLVLANREENREQDIAALEREGIPVWVAEPRTVPAAIADIRAMSELVGREAEGERVSRALEQRLADLECQAPLRRPSVAYVIWREPWMVAGDDTFVADMIRRAGGEAPFAGRYPEISLDALRSVDLILLATEPFPFTREHRDELLSEGFPEARVKFVDGELLSWHGVRMLQGLPYAAEVIR